MREKIPDNFYKMEESNNNMENNNYNNFNNYEEFNNDFREEKKIEEENQKDLLNAQKLKLLKRTKRK